jgi:protein-L-isoaspartate O-methyltransferase
MIIKAFLEMIRKRQLVPYLRLSRNLIPFYQLSYIAALERSGLLGLFAKGPLELMELMAAAGMQDGDPEMMEAWLQVGIRLNQIRFRGNQYSLNGLSKTLANRESADPLLAIGAEAATLHYKMILESPTKLRSGEKWLLSDHDGELIARSSRLIEPFIKGFIRQVVPERGPVRLLEAGPGSGIYLRHAAQRNPQLTALGVELQPDVAEMARQNIRDWGLEERIVIETGDIRAKEIQDSFDIITLYNNIYYFPVAERVAFLSRLGNYLKPDGSVVLVTGCQGGQPLMEFLNLWGASTEGCSRLPEPNEIEEQLREAGFRDIWMRNLVPGDALYVFQARRHG